MKVNRWTASALATLAMGVLMLVGRTFFTAPLPPEMLFNFTARFLGVPWVFNLIHSLPGGVDAYAKYVLFGTTVVIFLAAWFVFGGFYPALRRRLGAWGADTFYVVVNSLLTGLVLLPIQGLGLFGLSPNNYQYPPLASILWSAAFGLVFAATLHLLHVRRAHVYRPERRESLRTIAVGAALLGGAAVFGRTLLATAARAQSAVTGLADKFTAAISPYITPVPAHYVVSKNVINPSVPEERWSLQITGMVDNPLTLSLSDLQALETVERPSTLMCISNPVGGDLIGNSVWTGVQLSTLLAQAGVQAGATELILRAADNYADSFPIEAAMADGTIVAFLQNGEPLTRDHGFPARVLVPGIYGMKNVKWVTEIELVNTDFMGYWQTRGWSDTAIVRTMSRIDTGEAVRLDDGTVAVGGVAFAGLRGVQGVEVSVDGGDTWQEAQVAPAVNGLTWNLWGFSWNAEPGSYEVLVRATDGTGETQTAERSRPLPDGASGYHSVTVRVSG